MAKTANQNDMLPIQLNLNRVKGEFAINSKILKQQDREPVNLPKEQGVPY